MKKTSLLLALALVAAALVASITAGGAAASTSCSATAYVPAWGAMGSAGPNGASGTGKLTPGAHVSCTGGSTVTVKLCLQYENISSPTGGGYIYSQGGVYSPTPTVNVPWTSTLCNTSTTVANNSDYSGPTTYPIPPGSKYFQDCSTPPIPTGGGGIFGGGGDGGGGGGGAYIYRTDVKVTANDTGNVTTGDVYSSTGFDGTGCTQPHAVKCNFVTQACTTVSDGGAAAGQVSPFALPPPEGNDNGEYCDVEMFGIEPLPNGSIFMLPMHFVCGGIADYVELVITRGLYRIPYGGNADAPPISKLQWGPQGYGVAGSFEEGWTIGLFYTCQHSSVPNAFFEQASFEEIAAGGDPETTETDGWTQIGETVLADNCS